MIKPFSTRVHGMLDYSVGAVMALSPWLLGFKKSSAESWVPWLLGFGALLYSMITDYELGIVDVLSMRTHLSIDLTAGLIFIIAPWLFSFAKRRWWPHVFMGLLEIAVVLLTDVRSNKGAVA